MIKYLIITFLIFFGGDFILLKTIKIESDQIQTDHLGNFYSISKTSIIKFDSEGNETAQYSNSNLGEITYADVTDPYRVLLFFKNFNQVQLLDKNLTEIASPVSLDDLGFSQVEIACTSNLGGFWLYDAQSTQLNYVDRALEVKSESLPVNSVVDIVKQPNFLIEKNDFLYLNLPEVGILVFDKFGSYYKKIPLINLISFQVSKNDILFYENNSIFRYNHELMSTESIVLPDTMGVINSRIEGNKIYIQKDKRLMIYSDNNIK